MLNIEIKARCENLEAAEKAAVEAGAVFETVLRQKDTYFKTGSGRLKLRQIAADQNQLICYTRANTAGPRDSEYFIYTVADVDRLRMILEYALSVLVVVEKQRKLYMYDDVRIHLDKVTGLGDFIELEGVVDIESNYDTVRARVDYLINALAISERDLVSLSYSDLLLQT